VNDFTHVTWSRGTVVGVANAWWFYTM